MSREMRKKMPKVEKRDVALAFRVQRSVYEALKKAADENEVSLSGAANYVIKEWLRSNGYLTGEEK
jgi:hypothetical protein